ncbi:MAG: TRAP transporter substrate-binding protein DctP [Alphaproteobacteria bacterium]
MARHAHVSLLLAALAAPTPAALAQEITLRGVSAFPDATLYSKKFEAYVKEVNARGKGILQIRYLGGAPRVMPTFDVSKNLRDGIVDIVNNTSAFYLNVLPEADAFKLSEVPIWELRKTGGWDFINKIHNEKVNAYYLARVHQYDEFHIYLNKEIKTPDFAGLKIRVSPTYRAMVEALGGTAVASTPSDIYTMLERGTVDGYGWPAQGIFDFSWEKVTKYRIDPGFYGAEISFLVNLDVWNKKLNEAQRKLLQDIALKFEESARDDIALNAAERKKQEAVGIKAIRFSPADEQKYLAVAREAAWSLILKASPENGAKLKEILTKK